MAGKFGDLDRYYDPGLTLTVLGREYVLPLPSAELGLWCRRAAEVGADVHAASTEEEMQAAGERAAAWADDLPALPGDLTFQERMLGPAYRQMVADSVPDPYIDFCSTTAYVWIVAGEAAAERYWLAGGRPEALSPANRRERRAQRTGQISTGGAATTHTPASTSGTSSRKKSRSRRGGGSPGHKS